MTDRFDPARLQRAWDLLQSWVDRDECPAVSAVVGSSGGPSISFSAGRQVLSSDVPLTDDPIFLIASPTKPLTAMAVMMLVEAGKLLVVDPVARHVPEFAAGRKTSITLGHCLTHTSGLPDMLPENKQLRREHAPLEEFVRRVCALEPDFAAGENVQYQSMGYLMLGEVIRRVSGAPLPKFLKDRLFDPLDMRDTSLGMNDDWTLPERASELPRRERIVECRVPPGTDSTGWGWNSDYWRRLAAPWGGLLASAGDWAKLCRHLLGIHRGETGFVSRSTLAAMTMNQLVTMPAVPEVNRRTMPWGYGWQLNWPNHPRTFGDLLSPSAYGHWGATGTLVWIDPARDHFGVILTSEPMEDRRRRQARFCNAVCGALVG